VFYFTGYVFKQASRGIIPVLFHGGDRCFALFCLELRRDHKNVVGVYEGSWSSVFLGLGGAKV